MGGPSPAGAIQPIFDYPHSGQTVSGDVVTGGVVYRGPAPALQGLYFFTDFSTARIWSFRFDGSSPAAFNGNNVTEFRDWSQVPGFLPQTGSISSVSTFGTDDAGNVYFANLVDGEIFAIGIDSDGDGRIDPRDRCPAYASADQGDVDANGIGNVCECGDENGDGTLSVSDLLAINRSIFNPAVATPLCDANGDGICNVSDIISVNIDLFSPASTTRCARRPLPGN